MLNVKIILVEYLEPSGHLSLQILENQKITQSKELPTRRIMLVLLHKMNYSQQFSSGDTVSSLFFGQCGADLLSSFLNLGQYCCDAISTAIHIKEELFLWIWTCENQSPENSSFKSCQASSCSDPQMNSKLFSVSLVSGLAFLL